MTVGAGGGNASTLLSYDNLVKASVLAPFDDVVVGARASHHETSHYVAPGGLRSVCEHLLFGADTVLDRHVINLHRTTSSARYTHS